MSVFVSTTRISRKWLERKPKHELASIILANIDKIDLFADENTDSSSALDAVVAEATVRLTEERDILSNAYDRAAHGWSEVAEQLAEAQDAIKVEDARRQALESRISELIAEAKKITEERDALANLFMDVVYELRSHQDHPYCEMGVQMAIPDIKDAEKHLAARDARIRAEGRKAGLEEAKAAIRSKFQASKRSFDNQRIATLAGALDTLEKLAAQAGEVAL